jgi:hypothetical protein
MGTYHKQATLKFAAAAALAMLAVGVAPSANATSVPFTLTMNSDVLHASKLNLTDPTTIYQQLATCTIGDPGCTGGFTALGQPFEETGYFAILSADIATPIGLPVGDTLVLAFQHLTGTLSADGSAITFNPSASGAVGLFIETTVPLADTTDPFTDGSQELESFQVINPSGGTGEFDAFDSLTASSNVGITLIPDTGANTFTDASGNPFINGYIGAISVQPVLSNHSAGLPEPCPAFTGLTGMCSALAPDGDTGQMFIDPIPTPEPGSIALLTGGLMSLAWFARRRRAN